jgi:hypothetical protein
MVPFEGKEEAAQVGVEFAAPGRLLDKRDGVACRVESGIYALVIIEERLQASLGYLQPGVR